MKYQNIFFTIGLMFCMSLMQPTFAMLAKHRADTSLFKICVDGYPLESIRIIIKEVADVDAENVAQEKPLHLACIFGHLEIVKLLIQSGADINFKMRNSLTPLHCAVRSNRREIVKYLLRAGADSEIKNSKGLTPCELACCFKKNAVIELFANQSGEGTD